MVRVRTIEALRKPFAHGLQCRLQSCSKCLYEEVRATSCYRIYTLWLFNIAMENGPFIDDFPIKTSIYKGFSMAMLNNQMVTVTSSAKHGGTISMLVIRSGVFKSWRVCWVLWCSWVRVLVELFFTLTVIKLPLILGWIQKAGWNCCPYYLTMRWLLQVPTERPAMVWASSRNPFTARRCNSPSCADRNIPMQVGLLRMERYRKSIKVPDSCYLMLFVHEEMAYYYKTFKTFKLIVTS